MNTNTQKQQAHIRAGPNSSGSCLFFPTRESFPANLTSVWLTHDGKTLRRDAILHVRLIIVYLKKKKSENGKIPAGIYNREFECRCFVWTEKNTNTFFKPVPALFDFFKVPMVFTCRFISPPPTHKSSLLQSSVCMCGRRLGGSLNWLWATACFSQDRK